MAHDEAAQNMEKANDAMRQHWNNAVCREFDAPEYYTSVAVLLIRWADRLDDWSECGAEVSQSAYVHNSFALVY